MRLTPDQILATVDLGTLVRQAQAAAEEEGQRYFRDVMKGKDKDCGGNAWVEIPVKPIGQRLGKKLEQLGFWKTKSLGQSVFAFTFHHGLSAQGVTCLEKAQKGAARVFADAGFEGLVRTGSCMN